MGLENDRTDDDRLDSCADMGARILGGPSAGRSSRIPPRRAPVSLLALAATLLATSSLVALAISVPAEARDLSGRALTLSVLLSSAAVAAGLLALFRISRFGMRGRALALTAIGLGIAAQLAAFCLVPVLLLVGLAASIGAIRAGPSPSRPPPLPAPEQPEGEARRFDMRFATPWFAAALIAFYGIAVSHVLLITSPPWRMGSARWPITLFHNQTLLGMALVLAALYLGIPVFSHALNSAPRSAARLIAIACLTTICLSFAAIGAWYLRTIGLAKPSLLRAQCLAYTRGLAEALVMYAQDNEGVLPQSDSWCDAIEPYLPYAYASFFVCPAAPNLTCGYAYNKALSGVPLSALSDPAKTILVFESDAGWNASGGVELLPERPRHTYGDNYGLADGYARYSGRVVPLPRYHWREPEWTKELLRPSRMRWEP